MWIGSAASRMKRAKALELASKLKTEHGCLVPVQVLDDGDDSEVFWGALGGQIEVTAESDEVDENEVWLYKYEFQSIISNIFNQCKRISNVEGKLSVAPIEDVAITKNLLDTNSCFILDCETDIFVWLGKRAAMFEKRASSVLAKEIMGLFER